MQKIGSCGNVHPPARLYRTKLHQNVNPGWQTGMLLLVLLRKKLWRLSVAPGKGFELICEKMMYSSQRGTAVLKNRVCYGVPALALLLVQLSFSAHAFTLGNLRGSAVIGRSLDVAIQIHSEAGEEVSSNCVTAQVFYADTRQSKVSVSVVLASGTSPDSTVLVRSSAIVNEPVVTLEVSATCGSSIRRSYVLLADFPPVAASVATVPTMPGVVSVPPVAVLPAASSLESGSVPVTSQASNMASAKPVAVQPRQRKTGAKAANTKTMAVAVDKPVVRKVPVRASGKSVLKLDPSDFLSDRIDLLESTSLFAPTEDAMRHSRQITSLEADIKTLRALAASHDARMSDLTAKLQHAQENQMPAWLVYVIGGLVALVLVCLAAIVWLWLQLKRRGQEDSHHTWWQGQEVARDQGPPTELLPTAVPAAPTPVATPPDQPEVSPRPEQIMSVAVASEEPLADVDIDLNFELLEESLHGAFEVSTGSAPFEQNSIRHISVEPILDIRQQAEFFVSLGQTDRALQILKKQIAESTEPNPLVYLDLIMLHHSLGMKVEFRECRATFQQLFNGIIPDFPVFNLEGRDLEAYPEVLANLVSLWPRMDALAFLSACIFRDANAQHGGTFDLAAFRDLLMLHALAEALLAVQPDTVDIVMPAEALPERMLDIDFSTITEPNPPVSDK